MNLIAAFVGRILLALIFIISGASKLFDPAPAQALLASVGLPTNFALMSGVFELIAGLAIALGVFTRLFSILLAAFCIVTTLFFHNNYGDPQVAITALKNLAMAGGFLCLFAHSQMRWSYDDLRARRRHDLAARDAEARAHEAELREARTRRETVVDPTPGTVVHPAGTVVEPDGTVVRRRRWWQL